MREYNLKNEEVEEMLSRAEIDNDGMFEETSIDIRVTMWSNGINSFTPKKTLTIVVGNSNN
ncbi:MAG: hypothetical protein Ta2E_12430 [Mycoplasmoidaceae bacterium]|nr:MAG: hypothetical protein Ta2E_12430 [Mycoplasmoidaceae bacterium]